METAFWSETPALIAHYFSLVTANDGIIRFFAYASLINRHDPVKSMASHTVPNERARLSNMVVSMNLKTEKLFAGLESADDGYAEGVNVTVLFDDRKEAITEYIKRELGLPPWSFGIDDILENRSSHFAKIKGRPDDVMPKYKLAIVETEIASFEGRRLIPSLAVVTNSSLSTSLTHKSADHLAKVLVEDKQSLAYFWHDALIPARTCGMTQTKLEEIARFLPPPEGR